MSYGQAFIALVAIWEIAVLLYAIVAITLRKRIAGPAGKAARWFWLPHIAIAIGALVYWTTQVGNGGNSVTEKVIICAEALVWVVWLVLINFIISENHP
jgi:hypothetical protein